MTIEEEIEIEKASKINECLLKSFDNLMYQQNKMDNKAYIFIGFLIFIFKAFLKDTGNSTCFYSIILFLISIPLLCSLIPITTKLGVKWVRLFKQDDNKNEHNIFYYVDICHLSKERFKQVLLNEYGIENTTLSDNKLIEQILINAEILNAKVIGHGLFLWFLLFGMIVCVIKYCLQAPL